MHLETSETLTVHVCLLCPLTFGLHNVVNGDAQLITVIIINKYGDLFQRSFYLLNGFFEHKEHGHYQGGLD